MIEARTVEIDGTTYVVAALPAMQAVRLWHRLVKALGPALSKLVGAFVGTSRGGFELEKVDLADVDLDALGAAVATFFDSLPEEKFDAMIRDLLSTVVVQGSSVALSKSIDAHFRGNLSAMFRLAGASLEVNFGDFLDVLRSVASRAPAPPRVAA